VSAGRRNFENLSIFDEITGKSLSSVYERFSERVAMCAGSLSVYRCENKGSTR